MRGFRVPAAEIRGLRPEILYRFSEIVKGLEILTLATENVAVTESINVRLMSHWWTLMLSYMF